MARLLGAADGRGAARAGVVPSLPGAQLRSGLGAAAAGRAAYPSAADGADLRGSFGSRKQPHAAASASAASAPTPLPAGPGWKRGASARRFAVVRGRCVVAAGADACFSPRGNGPIGAERASPRWHKRNARRATPRHARHAAARRAAVPGAHQNSTSTRRWLNHSPLHPSAPGHRSRRGAVPCHRAAGMPSFRPIIASWTKGTIQDHYFKEAKVALGAAAQRGAQIAQPELQLQPGGPGAHRLRRSSGTCPGPRSSSRRSSRSTRSSSRVRGPWASRLPV